MADLLDAELEAFEQELVQVEEQHAKVTETISHPATVSAPESATEVKKAAPTSAAVVQPAPKPVVAASAEPVIGLAPFQSVSGDYAPMPKHIATSGKEFVRSIAGEKWVDATLDDFRLFAGDLGNECSDEALGAAFRKYPSFAKAKVIRDKRSGKSRGYGFVSFTDGEEFVRAFREMNGKYISGRPVKLRKSSWQDRTDGKATKRMWKEKTKHKKRRTDF